MPTPGCDRRRGQIPSACTRCNRHHPSAKCYHFTRLTPVILPRNDTVKTHHHPPLPGNQILTAAVINHRVGPDSAFHHKVETVPDAFPRFLNVVAHQHVSHHVRSRNPVTFQTVDTDKENLLVPEIVPSGIEPPAFELVVAILNRGQGFGGLVVKQPDI